MLDGATKQLRNLFRLLRSYSDGNSFTNPVDEQIRRTTARFLLGFSVQIRKTSRSSTYSDLAETILTYRDQLIEPENTFLIRPLEHESDAGRHQCVIDFINQLIDSIDHDLKNFIEPLSRNADQIIYYLAAKQFILKNGTTKKIALHTYHEQRHEEFCKIFQESEKFQTLLKFLYEHFDLLCSGNGPFKHTLKISENFRLAYKALVLKETVDLSHVELLSHTGKYSSSHIKRYFGYKDQASVERARRRCEHLMQWETLPANDLTKMYFIKAHYACSNVHEANVNQLKAICADIQAALKVVPVDFDAIERSLTQSIHDTAPEDEFKLTFLSELKSHIMNAGFDIDDTQLILRQALTELDTIVKASEFSLSYYRQAICQDLPAIVSEESNNELNKIVTGLLEGTLSTQHQAADKLEAQKPHERNYLQQRVFYYVAKSKFTTYTVISSIIIVLKLWYSLMLSLSHTIYTEPLIVPNNSEKWLTDSFRFLEQLFSGIVSALQLDNSGMSVSAILSSSFINSHQSFFYLNDSYIAGIKEPMLSCKKMIHLCCQCIEAFVFEGDHSKIQSIKHMMNELLDHVRNNPDGDVHGLLREISPHYYKDDNTNISTFQNFAFDLATSDPTLSGKQQGLILNTKRLLSTKGKLAKIHQVMSEFHNRCQKELKSTYQVIGSAQRVEFESLLSGLYSAIDSSTSDQDLSVFDTLKNNFLSACSEFSSTNNGHVKRFHLEYIDTIIHHILINDTPFDFDELDDINIRLPGTNNQFFTGETCFEFSDYVNFFRQVPNDCRSKIQLGRYIYDHLYKLDQQQTLEFIAIIVDMEAAVGMTFDLTGLVIKRFLHCAKEINLTPETLEHEDAESDGQKSEAEAPKLKEQIEALRAQQLATLPNLIRRHNTILRQSLPSTWWDNWINWWLHLLGSSNNASHYIEMHSQAKPTASDLSTSTHVTKTKGKFLSAQSSDSPTGSFKLSKHDKEGSDAESPQDDHLATAAKQALATQHLVSKAASTAEEMIHGTENDKGYSSKLADANEAQPLCASILETVRDTLVAAKLFDAVNSGVASTIVFQVGQRMICGNSLFNIHQTMKRLQSGTVLGANRDHLYQSNVSHFRPFRNDQVEIAEYLTNFIGFCVVKYIDEKSLTYASQPLYKDKQFQTMCAVYLEEQLKSCTILDFDDLDYYQCIDSLVNHLCFRGFNRDREDEMYQYLEFNGCGNLTSRFEIDVPKEHRTDFNIRHDRSIDHSEKPFYKYHISPGELLSRAVRYAAPDREKDFSELIMKSGIFHALPTVENPGPKHDSHYNPNVFTRNRANSVSKH